MSATDKQVTVYFQDDGRGPSRKVADQYVYSIGPDETKPGSPLQLFGDGAAVRRLLDLVYAELGAAMSDVVVVAGFQSGDGLLQVIGKAAFRLAAHVEHTNLPANKREKLTTCAEEVSNVIKSLPLSIVSPEQLTAINSAIRAYHHALSKQKGQQGLPTYGINFNLDSPAVIREHLMATYGLEEGDAADLTALFIKARTEGRGERDPSNPHGMNSATIKEILRSNRRVAALMDRSNVVEESTT